MLIKNDVYFQQVANKRSEIILETINLRVQAYPEYRQSYVYAKSVDSLSKIALRNVEIADLKEQRNYIVDNLLYEYLDKEELSQITSAFVQKSLTVKPCRFLKPTRFLRE
jgi:tyrosine-protein phosphatase YwqE